MGAHHDLVQRAVVLGVAVISAGPDGALDALVGITVHVMFLLCFDFFASMSPERKIMHGNSPRKCAGFVSAYN